MSDEHGRWTEYVDLDKIRPALGTEVSEDAVPEPPVDPVTKRGDVWLLGPHRVTCDDAYAADLPNHHALISDPPYGMQVDASWFGGPVGASLGGNRTVASPHSHLGKIGWDEVPFDPSRFASAAERVALFGANFYCTSLPEPGTWWVWDKRATAEGGVQNAYGMPFELIWLSGRRKFHCIRHLWAGFTRKAEEADKERLHPTQKPVAVMRELVEYLTSVGETVLDPFSGSGSTLIACHSIERRCEAMELDPGYVDVTATRFQRHTGIVPVLESTGEPHDFLVP